MRPLSLPAVRALAFAAIACCAVAIAIAIGGGLSVQLGPLAVRSHNPLRPFFLAVVCLGLALSRGTAALSSALAWHWEVLQRYARPVALILAFTTIAAGFRWGAFVAGGSDSYCYLNQAELIARGTMRDYEPLAEDLTWPGNFWSFVPAGHMPFGQPVPVLVPICPSGYPLIMAAARITAGRSAMFAITPLMGGLAVYLMFLLGRHLAGPAAGLLGAALSAASPTFLIQLFQPMNDVTAAALWAAALVAAIFAGSRGTLPAAAGAGLLTAAALVVRPNLLPLAAVTGIGVMLLPRDRTMSSRIACGAAFAAAAAVGPLVVLSVQNAMYGSPFRSGYGDLDKMFSAAHVRPNLERYLQWSAGSHTILIVLALAAPFALKRYGSGRTAWWLLCFAVATLACYLPVLSCSTRGGTRVSCFQRYCHGWHSPPRCSSWPSRHSPPPRGSRLSSWLAWRPSRCSFTPVRPATSSASAISNGGSDLSASSSRRCPLTPRSSRSTTAAASGSMRRNRQSVGRTWTKDVSTMRSPSCGVTAGGHTCSSNNGKSHSSASASPASVSAHWTGRQRPRSMASGFMTRTTTSGTGAVRR